MTESFVYFVQGESGGPIKIGTAAFPKQRIRELQTGSPSTLRILAACPGDHGVESAYHQRFAEHRIRGEWFNAHADIIEEIAHLNAGHRPRFGVAPATPEDNTTDHSSFLAASMQEAIKASYGTAPGWAQKVAEHAYISSQGVKSWFSRNSVPHITQLFNMCQRNPDMRNWLTRSMMACWIADQFDIDSRDAYVRICQSPFCSELLFNGFVPHEKITDYLAITWPILKSGGSFFDDLHQVVVAQASATANA